MQITPLHIDPLRQEKTTVLDKTDKGYRIIVWNDDVNTFEWVIQALVDICKHTLEQAEQCAMIIHSNGKYAVKEGGFEKLHPMCEAIINRGINATIEDSN